MLQSLLAAHPRIASFPESHFFPGLVPRRRWLRALGLASRRARPRYERFLRQVGYEEGRDLLPRTALFMRQYASAFVGVLDALANRQGKDLWLEKTPGHLRYTAEIEGLVPGAGFVHIVRDGADVVASLYEVTREHPGEWGRSLSIDECVDRWIEDVRISRACLHKPNHVLVRYERLVAEPGAVLAELCGFLGVDFSETMLREYGVAAERVVLESEPWKASVGGAIRMAGARKFREVFDEGQRRYILDKLAVVDLDWLDAGAGGTVV